MGQKKINAVGENGEKSIPLRLLEKVIGSWEMGSIVDSKNCSNFTENKEINQVSTQAAAKQKNDSCILVVGTTGTGKTSTVGEFKKFNRIWPVRWIFTRGTIWKLVILPTPRLGRRSLWRTRTTQGRLLGLIIQVMIGAGWWFAGCLMLDVLLSLEYILTDFCFFLLLS